MAGKFSLENRFMNVVKTIIKRELPTRRNRKVNQQLAFSPSMIYSKTHTHLLRQFLEDEPEYIFKK